VLELRCRPPGGPGGWRRRRRRHLHCPSTRTTYPLRCTASCAAC